MRVLTGYSDKGDYEKLCADLTELKQDTTLSVTLESFSRQMDSQANIQEARVLLDKAAGFMVRDLRSSKTGDISSAPRGAPSTRTCT